ncbi:MAG TPA: TonB-dependent receptor [Acidobacteriaceae bacterium]|jgi:iron complex outermembrane receptor protein/vitamin B12 transporter|nr:TonB-dependent receptor [Acidobacteriaceae bacterium]
MSAISGRLLAAFVSRARHASAALLCLLPFCCTAAYAVIVRGTVSDPLGRPVAGAIVQLLSNGKPVGKVTAAADGTYMIEATESGRFTVAATAANFYTSATDNFFGASTDNVTQNVVLQIATLRQEITVTATGVPTPLEQLSSPVTLIPRADLATQVGIVDALRLSPGVEVVQTGQTGGATSLFVRGANSDASKVIVDGIPAEDIGGRFDFGTVSTTGLAVPGDTSPALELYRGPDSVLYGTNAAAAVVVLSTPHGTSSRPLFDYSGDAGNLHTYRNEAALSGAHGRLDYYGTVSRLNTSNSLPNAEYHSVTGAANLGYSFTANTRARFTIRNADSASGLPGPYDFFGIAANGKQEDQDLYSGLTLENRTVSGWHNLVRYGIGRKREQSSTYSATGQFLNDAYGGDYYGQQVTIRGANGYTATGRAILTYACYSSPCYPQTDYVVSNRDQLFYQSDYTFPHRIVGLFGFRYEKERGSFVYPAFFENEPTRRDNFEYTLQFSGDISSRLFYSVGGAVEKNHLFGVAGTPRIGLAYVPVYPGSGLFRGTKFRANVATGVQEPSIIDEYTSLYGELLQSGDTKDIQAYNVTPMRALRSRSFDVGVDQNIAGDKLVLKLGYFHNQFSHQVEYVDSGTLKAYFGISGFIPNFFGADLNSLAFRAQGFESELQWQPTAHIFARGGYTYLDAVVEQSFSSAAIAARGGYAAVNPSYPNIPIGSSPFVGARPFRRPPHTGFFTVQYTARRFTAALQGALASRSDDSTFLDYADLAGTNSMILPNRNLDYGYAKLDANLTYAIKPRVRLFTQLNNLLDQQHIGPIGFPALPFTVRAGVKVRFGGE